MPALSAARKGSSETMATNLPPSAHPKNSKESTWQETWKAMMYDDIIEEIHAQRAAVSDRFGGDMASIVRYYQSFDVPIPVSKDKPQVRRIPVPK